MPRQPLASIVWENGTPTYARPFPTDFFTIVMHMRAVMAYRLGIGPKPVDYAA